MGGAHAGGWRPSDGSVSRFIEAEAEVGKSERRGHRGPRAPWPYLKLPEAYECVPDVAEYLKTDLFSSVGNLQRWREGPTSESSCSGAVVGIQRVSKQAYASSILPDQGPCGTS